MYARFLIVDIDCGCVENHSEKCLQCTPFFFFVVVFLLLNMMFVLCSLRFRISLVCFAASVWGLLCIVCWLEVSWGEPMCFTGIRGPDEPTWANNWSILCKYYFALIFLQKWYLPRDNWKKKYQVPQGTNEDNFLVDILREWVTNSVCSILLWETVFHLVPPVSFYNILAKAIDYHTACILHSEFVKLTYDY